MFHTFLVHSRNKERSLGKRVAIELESVGVCIASSFNPILRKFQSESTSSFLQNRAVFPARNF